MRGRTPQVGPLTWHTTSVIGGSLFILLGALFLLFDGAAALPSLPHQRRGEAGLEEHTWRGSAAPCPIGCSWAFWPWRRRSRP
ncbi:hypothetical protein ACTWJ8_02165 [Streptomyces sp. SDT5-1]|uniref:hypothetical protein n=1 Tax=Streptomyces sp. SDT5-1 TaxID=3406418 RepID=UPI003FD0E6E8